MTEFAQAIYKKTKFWKYCTQYALLNINSADTERDVFNEKPTKEELVSQTDEVTSTRLANTAVMHTSMGDIHVKLFPKE